MDFCVVCERVSDCGDGPVQVRVLQTYSHRDLSAEMISSGAKGARSCCIVECDRSEREKRKQAEGIVNVTVTSCIDDHS